MFPAANVIVLMRQSDGGGRVQRFYREHTDNVMCFRMHGNGKICASGQVGRTPKLLVWDTQSLVTVSELVGHYGGVSHVSFSPTAEGGEGKLLASVGLDEHHSLIIHDWRSGAIVASCKGNPAKTFDVSWSPQVRLPWCCTLLLTCGAAQCCSHAVPLSCPGRFL